MSSELKQKLRGMSVVPVVVIENPENAVSLAEALIKGGLPIAEVTFRTDSAHESIRAMRDRFPEMLIGAGTVINEQQLQQASGAGADFVVSPGFNPVFVRRCLELGVDIVPGINSPSGIEASLAEGIDFVKFFPAEQSGGVEMLKALSGPYRGVSFMPTGGIGLGNILDYLALPSVVACGGSWMVPENLISEGRFDEIESLTRAAVKLVQQK